MWGTNYMQTQNKGMAPKCWSAGGNLERHAVHFYNVREAFCKFKFMKRITYKNSDATVGMRKGKDRCEWGVLVMGWLELIFQRAPASIAKNLCQEPGKSCTKIPQVRFLGVTLLTPAESHPGWTWPYSMPGIFKYAYRKSGPKFNGLSMFSIEKPYILSHTKFSFKAPIKISGNGMGKSCVTLWTSSGQGILADELR